MGLTRGRVVALAEARVVTPLGVQALAPQQATGAELLPGLAVTEARGGSPPSAAGTEVAPPELGRAPGVTAPPLSAGQLAKALHELHQLRERVLAQSHTEIIELAQILAQRVLGREVSMAPDAIAELAAQALREARGAQSVSLHVNPVHVPALQKALPELSEAANTALAVVPDNDLAPADLVLETEIGNIDARIATQLANLASVMTELAEA